MSAGRIVWVVPIRFWETADYSPHRAVLRPGRARSGRHVYAVRSDLYGHAVYLPARDCFPSWIAARREQHRRAAAQRIADAEEWQRHWRDVLAGLLAR